MKSEGVNQPVRRNNGPSTLVDQYVSYKMEPKTHYTSRRNDPQKGRTRPKYLVLAVVKSKAKAYRMAKTWDDKTNR